MNVKTRVDALAREMGLTINPAEHARIPHLVSSQTFFKHFTATALHFMKTGLRVNTAKLTRETVLFCILLYLKPPTLALISANIEKRWGEASILFETGVEVLVKIDPLTEIFGPLTSRRARKLEKNISEPRIPISGKYAVLAKPVEATTPKYIVSNKWYVYTAEVNPIPYNIIELLSATVETEE